MSPHGDEQAGCWEGMLHNVLDFNAVHGNTAVREVYGPYSSADRRC